MRPEASPTSNSLNAINSKQEIQTKLLSRSQKKQLTLATHQENPLQLVLNVLHPGKGRHALDHLNEDAAHSPERQNDTPAQHFRKHLLENMEKKVFHSPENRLLLCLSKLLWWTDSIILTDRLG